MVEPRGSASEEPAARTFKEAARTVSVGFATWLLLWNGSASGKGDAGGDRPKFFAFWSAVEKCWG